MSKVERSSCGSGGCVTCPFSLNEEAEQVKNYGCLPDPWEIVEMKEETGHNWSCHYEEKVCGGLAAYIKENRPDLDVREGNLISYEVWSHEGEEGALRKADEGGGKVNE